jgi:hypothetical protein
MLHMPDVGVTIVAWQIPLGGTWTIIPIVY